MVSLKLQIVKHILSHYFIGTYGNELFLCFDKEKPTFGQDSLDKLPNKSSFVVYGIFLFNFVGFI